MTEFIFIKLLLIFFSFGFLFLSWGSKKVVGYWLNPSSIFSLFWFLYTFIPLSLAFPVPIEFFGIMYIFLFNFLFVSSVCIFNWKFAFNKNLEKRSASDVFDTLFLRFCFYVVSAISIVSLVIGVSIQSGLNVFDFFVNPLIFAGDYASKGYGGGLQESMVAKLGLSTSYIVVIIGGVLFGSGGRRKHILFLSFTPSLLVMLLQSAKGLFFYSFFVFLAGILISQIYNKNYSLLEINGIKKTIRYSFLVLPVVIMSFLARGLQSVSDLDIIIYRIVRFSISYSSGHLYAFSDWFSDRYFTASIFPHKQEEITYGWYSLMSFFRLFGSEKKADLGVYTVYYEHPFYLKTNIYTVFRGLITDFSLFGSLVVALFLGLICNLFFYRLLCSKNNPFYIVFFIFFVGISYQSYIISTLMWPTIPVVFVTLCLFFSVYFSVYKTRKI